MIAYSRCVNLGAQDTSVRKPQQPFQGHDILQFRHKGQMHSRCRVSANELLEGASSCGHGDRGFR